MKKIAIFLANGFEEIEALTPKDVMSRAGFKCDFVSISDDFKVTSTHGVQVVAEKKLKDICDINEYDMIILPGGMPGAKYLAESEAVIEIVRRFNEQGKYIGAICAAPALVFSKAGIAKGRRVTSYPGMDEYLKDSIYAEEAVVQDENLISSRGPATALQFSYKLVEVLGENPQGISDGMLYNYYQ